jgi:hypothetical protein
MIADEWRESRENGGMRKENRYKKRGDVQVVTQ